MFLKMIKELFKDRPRFKEGDRVILCPTFGGSRKATVVEARWDELLEEWRYDLSFDIFENTRHDSPPPRATDWAERSLVECSDSTGA